MNRPLTILVSASITLLAGAIVQAEMPAVPPPSLSTEILTIPKAMIRAYQTQVHPSYLHWLANGDGGEDSLAAFELFLSMQGVNRYEAWCFTELYIRSH
jgi:hypothetical protein